MYANESSKTYYKITFLHRVEKIVLDTHLVCDCDIDLHLVNDFYRFSKFCLIYSRLLFYTNLDDLKVMF